MNNYKILTIGCMFITMCSICNVNATQTYESDNTLDNTPPPQSNNKFVNKKRQRYKHNTFDTSKLKKDSSTSYDSSHSTGNNISAQYDCIADNEYDNIIQYRDNNNTIKTIELPYPEWKKIDNLQEKLMANTINIPEELQKLDDEIIDNKFPLRVSDCENIEQMIRTIYNKEYKNPYIDDEDYGWRCKFALTTAEELTAQSKVCYKYRSIHSVMDCYRKVMSLLEMIGTDQTSNGYTMKVGPTSTSSMTPNHITDNNLAEQILHKYSKMIFINFTKYVLKYVYPKVYSTPIETYLFAGMYDMIAKLGYKYDANIEIFTQSILEKAKKINDDIDKLKNNSLTLEKREIKQEQIIEEYYSFASQTNYLTQLIEQNDKLNKDPTIRAYLLRIKNI